MKKSIYILMIFSFFLLFNQKVNAFELIQPSVDLSNIQGANFDNQLSHLTIGTPSPLDYGQATYNYIQNNFINGDVYKDYGNYYFCLFNGTLSGSDCYISNDMNSFSITPYKNGYGYIYFTIKATSDAPVYKYYIRSGQKQSTSSYLNSYEKVSFQFSNSSKAIITNIKYLKMYSSEYNTFIIDNYYFNNNDIVIYFDNKEAKVNKQYKLDGDFTDYKGKTSITFDKSAASYDIYINNSDDLDKLSFKLNYFDSNNYSYYENNLISQPKVYTVMFYGLKNTNGLYNWEMLDDCTNPDFPSEFCDLRASYEDMYNDKIHYNELGSFGFTFKATIDFLDIFDTYDEIRVVVRFDNMLKGKIDYWDTNSKIDYTNLDLNYFGFDYSKQINHSIKNRYILFTTKEQNISGNLYITSSSDEIFVDYFNTKLLMFTDYSKLSKRKDLNNTYFFRYENIGLNSALGFYILTDKNRVEDLIYHFYVKPNLYFSFNNSDTLDNSIFIDNEGNIIIGDISITPDEFIGFKFDNIDDLFENINKFNTKISKVTEEIHNVVQYAYDSLNIYIQSFLITIFTIILVCATIKIIRM